MVFWSCFQIRLGFYSLKASLASERHILGIEARDIALGPVVEVG